MSSNISQPAVNAAIRVSDCFPLPPTPTNRACPWSIRITRWMRVKCSNASSNNTIFMAVYRSLYSSRICTEKILKNFEKSSKNHLNQKFWKSIWNIRRKSLKIHSKHSKIMFEDSIETFKEKVRRFNRNIQRKSLNIHLKLSKEKVWKFIGNIQKKFGNTFETFKENVRKFK